MRLGTPSLSAYLVVVLIAELTLLVSSAAAFADLFRFNDPAVSGGASGRWFTGSPADGYSCDVCHVGETANQVVVRGLPERYAPNARYDLRVEWPASVAHVTAVVEMTDLAGRGAGFEELAGTLSAAETCQPIEAGVPAALVLRAPEIELANDRQLVGMQDCGGNVLHWQWTAPANDVGPVLFAGGVIAPDQRQDAAGDRIAKLFKQIASPSQSTHVTQISSGCSTVARGYGGCEAHAVIGLVCSFMVAFYRRPAVRSRGAPPARERPEIA